MAHVDVPPSSPSFSRDPRESIGERSRGISPARRARRVRGSYSTTIVLTCYIRPMREQLPPFLVLLSAQSRRRISRRIRRKHVPRPEHRPRTAENVERPEVSLLPRKLAKRTRRVDGTIPSRSWCALVHDRGLVLRRVFAASRPRDSPPRWKDSLALPPYVRMIRPDLPPSHVRSLGANQPPRRVIILLELEGSSA